MNSTSKANSTNKASDAFQRVTRVWFLRTTRVLKWTRVNKRRVLRTTRFYSKARFMLAFFLFFNHVLLFTYFLSFLASCTRYSGRRTSLYTMHLDRIWVFILLYLSRLFVGKGRIQGKNLTTMYGSTETRDLALHNIPFFPFSLFHAFLILFFT